MGIIDRITGQITGRAAKNETLRLQAALEREKANGKIAVAIEQRVFAAAKLSRLTESWLATRQEINDELRSDLDALRNRARTLEHDNDYAKRFLGMVETHMIGDEPPRLVSTVENSPGVQDELAVAAIEAGWADFSRAGICEVSGQYSLRTLCWNICRGTARDGEYLLRHIRGTDAGNKYGYAVQVIDVADLATRFYRDRSDGQNEIKAGIERDVFGRFVAAHFLPETRSTAGQTVRVLAGELLHKFIITRPGQARGIPWMHAAMLSMHYAGEFSISALVAAKHGADHLGFFVSPDGEPPRLGDDKADEPGAQIMTSAAGTWDTLPTGYDVKNVDSKYPNEVFGPFMKTANQRMACGLEVSYPNLCNDYEAVNFSSIRAAVLDERDSWRKKQKWFGESWLEPIFTEWLRLALANGALTLPNGSPLPLAKIGKFMAHSWQFRGWKWVDPVKDIEAARAELELNITSHSRLSNEAGRDFEETLAEKRRDKATAERYGIDLSIAAPAGNGAAPPQPTHPTD